MIGTMYLMNQGANIVVYLKKNSVFKTQSAKKCQK